MIRIDLHKIQSLPMVTREGLQRIELEYTCSHSCHLILEVLRGEAVLLREKVALLGGRYSDTGLKEHTRYFYRVRAVDTAGRKSPLSREFSAWTRERTDD